MAAPSYDPIGHVPRSYPSIVGGSWNPVFAPGSQVGAPMPGPSTMPVHQQPAPGASQSTLPQPVAGSGSIGQYQTPIGAGALPQATIDQYANALAPPLIHNNYGRSMAGVSPQAAAEMNQQANDQAGANYLSTRNDFTRNAAVTQANMQNTFNQAQASDTMAGFNNLMGGYRNDLNYQIGQNDLQARVAALLAQLTGAT